MQQYRVANGSLRKPRVKGQVPKVRRAVDYIGQGELVPDGMLTQEEIEKLLETGVIEALPTGGPAGAAAPTYAARGKWSVDPSALVSKTLEDLCVMILEIDPNYDVAGLDSIQAATILTADWHPAFRETLATSSDKSRPAPLSMTSKQNAKGKVVEQRGAKDAGSRPMSEDASATLEALRARAQEKAPTE